MALRLAARLRRVRERAVRGDRLHRIPAPVRGGVGRLAHAAPLVRPRGRARPCDDGDRLGARPAPGPAPRRSGRPRGLRARLPPRPDPVARAPGAPPRRARPDRRVTHTRACLGDVPPRDPGGRAGGGWRAPGGPRAPHALDARRRGGLRRAPGARLPDAGLGAARPRRGSRGRRSRRTGPATLGSGRDALGRRASAPRAVARQPAGRARERARVQPPAAGGLAAPPPAGELLRRPPYAPRARAPRHAARAKRARPAPVRRLVGRLGADVGQPAPAGAGRAAPVRRRRRSGPARCSSA